MSAVDKNSVFGTCPEWSSFPQYMSLSPLLSQMRAMMRGSAYADSVLAAGGIGGHQRSIFSPLHAQTSAAFPSKRDACARTNELLTKYLARYRDSLQDRNLGDPYFWLGIALHPVMDSTSPAHRNFQYWDQGEILRHGSDTILGIRWPTEEGLSDLLARPEVIYETLDLMHQATSGQGVDCSCYE